MKKKINRIISIFCFLLLTSCGFKVLEKSELLNFNIKEIEISGNKKINYHISNNIKNIIRSKNAIDELGLKIKSTQTKSIKEKNDKNQITKYQIVLVVETEVNIFKRSIKKNINTSIKGDYKVETNHESTLSNQNNLEIYLAKKASDYIINQLSLMLNDL